MQIPREIPEMAKSNGTAAAVVALPGPELFAARRAEADRLHTSRPRPRRVLCEDSGRPLWPCASGPPVATGRTRSARLARQPERPPAVERLPAGCGASRSPWTRSSPAAVASRPPSAGGRLIRPPDPGTAGSIPPLSGDRRITRVRRRAAAAAQLSAGSPTRHSLSWNAEGEAGCGRRRWMFAGDPARTCRDGTARRTDHQPNGAGAEAGQAELCERSRRCSQKKIANLRR